MRSLLFIITLACITGMYAQGALAKDAAPVASATQLKAQTMAMADAVPRSFVEIANDDYGRSITIIDVMSIKNAGAPGATVDVVVADPYYGPSFYRIPVMTIVLDCKGGGINTITRFSSLGANVSYPKSDSAILGEISGLEFPNLRNANVSEIEKIVCFGSSIPFGHTDPDANRATARHLRWLDRGQSISSAYESFAVEIDSVFLSGSLKLGAAEMDCPGFDNALEKAKWWANRHKNYSGRVNGKSSRHMFFDVDMFNGMGVLYVARKRLDTCLSPELTASE